jgi:hypothetical protein
VSSQEKKPIEFRLYRQVLTAGYLSVALAVAALLTASIVKELFFRPSASAGAAEGATRPDPQELLSCHEMTLDLLTSLGAETCALLGLPPQGERTEVASRWEDFTRTWRSKWEGAGSRCRFKELSGTEMGVAFDRLAGVHGDLPSMRLKYKSLLDRFEEEQAAELVRMRRALDLSRRDLAEQVEEAEPTPPTR